VNVRVVSHELGISWVESGAIARAAHAVSDGGRVWLIDPFDDTAALAAAAQLGEPAGVLQLLDRHNRDCEAIAARLGVPLTRLPSSGAGTPFEVLPIMSRGHWKEVALWWPQCGALVVAEAIGTAPGFAVGRDAGVHPMLRLTPPRSQLSPYRPELLLVGHGQPLTSGAAAALQEALARSRSDIPRLVVKLPWLLRGN
jgi:hypothetical protein